MPAFRHHEREDPVPPRGTLDRFLLHEQTGWSVAYACGNLPQLRVTIPSVCSGSTIPETRLDHLIRHGIVTELACKLGEQTNFVVGSIEHKVPKEWLL